MKLFHNLHPTSKMENVMDFNNTVSYIYGNCISRVKNRLNELNVPQYSICPEDKSLVSRFFTGTLTKNNPYLITDKLFSNTDKAGKKCGFFHTLGFNSYVEVLWGNNQEFKRNLPCIFRNIMIDLLENNSEHGIEMELLLCDYVQYAKYSTLSQIKERDNISLLKYFSVYNDTVSPINMFIYRERALNFLFSKKEFSNCFEDSFSKFANDTLTFTKINQSIVSDFIFPVFIPLLKNNLPSSDSLGIRVKNLIENDLAKTKVLIDPITSSYSNSYKELARMIINASSAYIIKLEEIQEKYISDNGLM